MKRHKVHAKKDESIPSILLELFPLTTVSETRSDSPCDDEARETGDRLNNMFSCPLDSTVTLPYGALTHQIPGI